MILSFEIYYSYVMNICHNQFMCYFDYGNVEKNKQMYMFLVSDSHIYFLKSACDKLPIGCSSHKSQTLNAWMILTSRHVSFISCIIQMFYMVYERFVRIM